MHNNNNIIIGRYIASPDHQNYAKVEPNVFFQQRAILNCYAYI